MHFSQKKKSKFVKFVHTVPYTGAILCIVKTPPILYIVFTTPHNRESSPKRQSPHRLSFFVSGFYRAELNKKGIIILSEQIDERRENGL